MSMGQKVSIEEMASAVVCQLTDYAQIVTHDMKKAVKDAAKTVKAEIATHAPKRTGRYAKSWTTKTTRENAGELEITVHSKDHYQLAHLLEFGHAKRGGGRVAARPHIAPAEQVGIEQLERDVGRSLKHG